MAEMNTDTGKLTATHFSKWKVVVETDQYEAHLKYDYDVGGK